MTIKKHPATILFGGIILLLIAMGISRFAFTPILPFMREEVGFSIKMAGYLASSNYIGYFIGALLAGLIRKQKKKILYWHIAGNILSVICMGLSDSFFVWLFLRLIAGISSGMIFVLTSSIVLDYFISHAHTKWSGFLFSGVGFGIAISGLFVPILHHSFSWEGAWIGLGGVASILAIVAFLLWQNLSFKTKQQEQPITSKPPKFNGMMPWLIAAYGLEGLGYIVTATFLVDIIRDIPSLASYSTYAWVLVGLAIIPSTALWTRWMEKMAPIVTLTIALLLQAIGIMLPVFSQTIWSVSLAAILFGFTFMGIVTITTAYARQIVTENSTKTLSQLTSTYAIGQIIGPIIAGMLAAHYHSYKAALLFAGLIILFSIVLLLFGYWRVHVRETTQNTLLALNYNKEQKNRTL